MLSRASQQAESPHAVYRLHRFIGWFGIIYALLTLSQVYDYRFLFRGGIVLSYHSGRLLCAAAVHLAGIWLLLGSVRLLRSKRNAAGMLLGWAIFVLTLEFMQTGLLVMSPVTQPAGILSMIAFQSLRTSLQAGFPLVLLAVMTLSRPTGTGFDVLLRTADPRSSQPQEAIPAVIGDVDHRLAWIGLFLGAAGALNFILMGVGPGLAVWKNAESFWRTSALLIIGLAKITSYLLLLCGAILALRGRPAGRRVLLTWTVLFLLLALLEFVLYDIPFLAWQSSNGPALPYRFMSLETMAHILTLVRTTAFAVIALYVLGLPALHGPATAGGGGVAATAATKPATSGL